MTPSDPAVPAAEAQRPPAVDIIRRRLDVQILTRARVVVIGLGGIGLFLARALVTFLAGLGRTLPAGQQITVVLCDGDAFEPDNTYRMDVPDFGNKAIALGQELLDRCEDCGLAIRWVPEYVHQQNVETVIREGDCVLLASDNHATRKLVSRRCSEGGLGNVVLISGGNDGVEDGQTGTCGNVQVYVRQDGHDVTAPLDAFHPEIADPADKPPEEMTCAELAAAGVPQLVFVNMAVASAMCSALLRLLMPPERQPPYDEVVLDILEGVNQPHWISGPEPDRG